MNSAVVNPAVKLDKPGNYVFSLKVSDGSLSSISNVNITARKNASELILGNSLGVINFENRYSPQINYSMHEQCEREDDYDGYGCTSVGIPIGGKPYGEFYLEAKGGDFTIINLKAITDDARNRPTVQTPSFNLKYPSRFENLSNNQVIKEGERVYFKIKVVYAHLYTMIKTEHAFTVKETGQSFSALAITYP